MDFLLLKRIADSCLEKRATEIKDYVYGFLLEEISDEGIAAGLRRLKSEQRARVLKEDEEMMKRALEEKRAEPPDEIHGAAV